MTEGTQRKDHRKTRDTRLHELLKAYSSDIEKLEGLIAENVKDRDLRDAGIKFHYVYDTNVVLLATNPAEYTDAVQVFTHWNRLSPSSPHDIGVTALTGDFLTGKHMRRAGQLVGQRYVTRDHARELFEHLKHLEREWAYVKYTMEKDVFSAAPFEALGDALVKFSAETPDMADRTAGDIARTLSDTFRLKSVSVPRFAARKLARLLSDQALAPLSNLDLYEASYDERQKPYAIELFRDLTESICNKDDRRKKQKAAADARAVIYALCANKYAQNERLNDRLVFVTSDHKLIESSREVIPPEEREFSFVRRPSHFMPIINWVDYGAFDSADYIRTLSNSIDTFRGLIADGQMDAESKTATVRIRPLIEAMTSIYDQWRRLGDFSIVANSARLVEVLREAVNDVKALREEIEQAEAEDGRVEATRAAHASFDEISTSHVRVAAGHILLEMRNKARTRAERFSDPRLAIFCDYQSIIRRESLLDLLNNAPREELSALLGELLNSNLRPIEILLCANLAVISENWTGAEAIARFGIDRLAAEAADKAPKFRAKGSQTAPNSAAIVSDLKYVEAVALRRRMAETPLDLLPDETLYEEAERAARQLSGATPAEAWRRHCEHAAVKLWYLWLRQVAMWKAVRAAAAERSGPAQKAGDGRSVRPDLPKLRPDGKLSDEVLKSLEQARTLEEENEVDRVLARDARDAALNLHAQRLNNHVSVYILSAISGESTLSKMWKPFNEATERLEEHERSVGGADRFSLHSLNASAARIILNEHENTPSDTELVSAYRNAYRRTKSIGSSTFWAVASDMVNDHVEAILARR